MLMKPPPALWLYDLTLEEKQTEGVYVLKAKCSLNQTAFAPKPHSMPDTKKNTFGDENMSEIWSAGWHLRLLF